MNTLTTYIIFSIFLSFFSFLIKCSRKIYKNYKYPSRESHYFKRKKRFFNEIYSNNIEPIFKEFIIQYFINFSHNLESFAVFERFIKSIKELLKSIQKSENKDNFSKANSLRKEMKEIIKSSETYDSVYTDLEPEMLIFWARKFKTLNKFSNFLKELKTLEYFNYGAILLLFISLLIINFQVNLENSTIIYLIICAIVTVFLLTFILFSYFKDIKDIKTIFKYDYYIEAIIKGD